MPRVNTDARLIKYTAGTKATCPKCGYKNDYARVDYCPHFIRRTKVMGFKPNRWVFKKH